MRDTPLLRFAWNRPKTALAPFHERSHHSWARERAARIRWLASNHNHRQIVAVDPEPGMKIVGRARERSVIERFARLQAMTDKIAARPYMRRGTVLKFRTWDEFNTWKRQATSAPRATPNSPTS